MVQWQNLISWQQSEIGYKINELLLVYKYISFSGLYITHKRQVKDQYIMMIHDWLQNEGWRYHPSSLSVASMLALQLIIFSFFHHQNNFCFFMLGALSDIHTFSIDFYCKMSQSVTDKFIFNECNACFFMNEECVRYSPTAGIVT